MVRDQDDAHAVEIDFLKNPSLSPRRIGEQGDVLEMAGDEPANPCRGHRVERNPPMDYFIGVPWL